MGILDGSFLLSFLLSNFDRFEDWLRQTWAFYDLSFPRCNSLDFPLEKLFLLEILPGLPVRNKISKRSCMFFILNRCFAAELLLRQSKGSEL